MLIGVNNEERIYNFLIDNGFSVFGACGILGNLHAESACNPINLQNSGNSKLNISDWKYTNEIDIGQRDFIDGIGYGIAQWTYPTRKKALLEFARKHGTSIGDLEMQLNFLLVELKQYGLIEKLKHSQSVEESARMFMLDFEKPANKTEENIKKRVGYSNVYYEKFAPKKSQLEIDMDTIYSVGITNTPIYWVKNAEKLTWLPEFIHNVANYIRGEKK